MTTVPLETLIEHGLYADHLVIRLPYFAADERYKALEAMRLAGWEFCQIEPQPEGPFVDYQFWRRADNVGTQETRR